MAIRVGINGFGRIGRVVARLLASDTYRNKVTLAAINDLTDAPTLAHLFAYDSVHGRFKGSVAVEGSTMVINGQSVAVSAEKDPTKISWKERGVDIVLECTGIFRSKEMAGLHLKGGAKKVIVSAPSDDPDLTLAFGVNHHEYDPARHDVVSCASCTTNCLAPVAKVLLDTFGILKGTMTTVHSYTNDQNILDLPHKDLRRARAAALSMIPTTTGAAKAVGLVLPSLKGKVDGLAIRVPTPDVSVVDFVALTEKPATIATVNGALKAASEGALKGILEFSTLPLVSVDYIGNQSSSIVDSQSTMVVGDNLVKIISWYDNETGFSARMIDTTLLMASKM